jgi:hypothetical protein
MKTWTALAALPLAILWLAAPVGADLSTPGAAWADDPGCPYFGNPHRDETGACVANIVVRDHHRCTDVGGQTRGNGVPMPRSVYQSDQVYDWPELCVYPPVAPAGAAPSRSVLPPSAPAPPPRPAQIKHYRDQPQLDASYCLSIVWDPGRRSFAAHNRCAFAVTYEFCVQATGTLYPCTGANGQSQVAAGGDDPFGSTATQKGSRVFEWFACHNQDAVIPILASADPPRGQCMAWDR